jgi:hypothetical protein
LSKTALRLTTDDTAADAAGAAVEDAGWAADGGAAELARAARTDASTTTATTAATRVTTKMTIGLPRTAADGHHREQRTNPSPRFLE